MVEQVLVLGIVVIAISVRHFNNCLQGHYFVLQTPLSSLQNSHNDPYRFCRQ